MDWANFDLFNLIKHTLLAMLMTIGWSLAFNLPKHHIWKCLLITLWGFGLRTLLLQLTNNLILATFISALLAAFLAIFLSRRYLITPKTLSVPALVCMMPGVTAYKAMVSLVQIGYYGYTQPLFNQVMEYGFESLFVTAALVFGLSLPATIFYRKKPIV